MQSQQTSDGRAGYGNILRAQDDADQRGQDRFQERDREIHMQGHRIHGAEKEAVRTALAQHHIGMDGAVAEDARLYQAVGDENEVIA